MKTVQKYGIRLFVVVAIVYWFGGIVQTISTIKPVNKPQQTVSTAVEIERR